MRWARRSGTRSRTVLFAALAVYSVACGGGGGRVENAVLICLDTVRYDTLQLVHEVAGNDAAARQWRDRTHIARVQSTAPWTLPAVASVFTGLYPKGHGAGVFPQPVADLTRHMPPALPQGVATLTAALSEDGFETAGFVAHPWFRSHFGLHREFDTLEVSNALGDALVSAATEWLDARSQRPDPAPFFLYLHLMEAHAPVLWEEPALAEYLSQLSEPLRERGIASRPALCRDPSSLDCMRYLAYIRAVAGLRGHVARLLAGLEERGLLGRTVVVLFSDHGEEFRDHAAEEAERSMDPRGTYGLGHGHALFQELLHVPVAIWHPALPPGRVEMTVSLVDLPSTLLGWLGVEAELGHAGVDLGPLLAGEREPDPKRPLYSSAVAFGPERAAALRGTRKRISDGASGAGALVYDLAQDPSEKAPLDASHTSDLAALLDAYRGRSASEGAPADPTPETLRALQALGYLEEVGPD